MEKDIMTTLHALIGFIWIYMTGIGLSMVVVAAMVTGDYIATAIGLGIAPIVAYLMQQSYKELAS
jgi:flagellar biosynthesis protein FliR